jgi:hypothetical protein
MEIIEGVKLWLILAYYGAHLNPLTVHTPAISAVEQAFEFVAHDLDVGTTPERHCVCFV